MTGVFDWRLQKAIGDLLFDENGKRRVSEQLLRERPVGDLSHQLKLTEEALKATWDDYKTERDWRGELTDRLMGGIRIMVRPRPDESLRLPASRDFYVHNTPEGGKLYGSFDRVFRPDESNSTVWEEVEAFITHCISKEHKECLIFAHGRGNTGKTYLLGSQREEDKPEDRSLIPRAIDLVFEVKRRMNLEGCSVEVYATTVEFRGEQAFDLDNERLRTPAQVREYRCLVAGDAHTLLDRSYKAHERYRARNQQRILRKTLSNQSHHIFGLHFSINSRPRMSIRFIDLANGDDVTVEGEECNDNGVAASHSLDRLRDTLRDTQSRTREALLFPPYTHRPLNALASGDMVCPHLLRLWRLIC